MRRIGLSLFALLVAVAIVTVLGPFATAGSAKVRTQGNVKVVTVDDDGVRHEETFEFDADHPRPFLGVMLTDTEDGGVRVGSVVEGSAAEAAGLQAGDIIVGIDGNEVGEPWDLTRAVLESEVGQRVDLDVIRGDGRIDVSAELGQREGLTELDDLDLHMEGLEEYMEQLGQKMEQLDFHIDKHGDTFSVYRHGSRPKLGVQLVSATPELREHLGGSADAGVLVSKVMDGMPADDGGILVGDLIVAVDGEGVGGTGDLIRALAESDGQTIDVEVIRDGRSRHFDVVIPPRDDD